MIIDGWENTSHCWQWYPNHWGRLFCPVAMVCDTRTLVQRSISLQTWSQKHLDRLFSTFPADNNNGKAHPMRESVITENLPITRLAIKTFDGQVFERYLAMSRDQERNELRFKPSWLSTSEWNTEKVATQVSRTIRSEGTEHIWLNLEWEASRWIGDHYNWSFLRGSIGAFPKLHSMFSPNISHGHRSGLRSRYTLTNRSHNGGQQWMNQVIWMTSTWIASWRPFFSSSHAVLAFN